MKNYTTLKLRAIHLRKKGESYGDIKKRLNVSKSTLSYWLKGVILTQEQKNKLYTNKILNLSQGAQSQKERRSREIKQIIEVAKKEISSKLSFESYRLFGTALYWAEGNKKRDFEITNSDPSLITFMVGWFKDMFKIPPKNLDAWLNIYPQQNEDDLKNFWSQLTGIPLENFGKTFVKPLNKNYKKNNLYYGTIKVRVRRGTDMRHRVYGWIKAVLKNKNYKAELVQKEWRRLQEISRAVNLPK